MEHDEHGGESGRTTGEWGAFVADAAAALPIIESVCLAAARLIDAPYDPEAQRVMRDLLDSEGLRRATDAARRVAAFELDVDAEVEAELDADERRLVEALDHARSDGPGHPPTSSSVRAGEPRGA